jgi:hypothetical protein
MPTYYESATYYMRKVGVADSELPLQEVVGLVCEWVGFLLVLICSSHEQLSIIIILAKAHYD